MSDKIVAIIPARGGSQGIPRKNIKLLGGKPLIAYSIETALNSSSISHVVVSTEDTEIAQIAKQWGAQVVPRPMDLAQNTTATEPVLEHTVEYLEKKYAHLMDWIILLQPTSPFRELHDIENAYKKLKERGGDSLLSVCQNHNFLWAENKEGFAQPLNYNYEKRPRRQEMSQFCENGSIYITKRDILMKNHCRLGGNVVAYEMSAENSLEIDSFDDWRLAEHRISMKK